MYKIIFVLLFFSVFQVSGQRSISFYENTLDAALLKAGEEGKDVFLDTYAPWCKPCKKMDRVFRNGKVGAFYNEHFISVKVNVDLPTGKEIASKYGIAFLPTMLIMDANGNVKQRIDGLMNAEQMVQIGESVVNGASVAVVETVAKKPVKLSAKVSAPTTPVAEPGEKILFVLDDPAVAGNPEYLYHEAFLRLQLMDGSHDSIVQKYLATQDDWGSERNMEFIVNFMDNTDSELFSFFVENSADFQDMIGAAKYRNTLEILVNDCLYRQVPRPSPSRVRTLLSHLYPRKAEKYTTQYLLKRYEDQGDYAAFIAAGEEYLATLMQPEPELLYKLGKYKGTEGGRKEVKESVFRVEESIRLMDNPDYDQYLTLAKLYFKQGKERKTREAAGMALEMSLGDTEAQGEVRRFTSKLEKL